ncbi:hypothetical protein vseg_002038 [Gypsophila vaccaria]
MSQRLDPSFRLFGKNIQIGTKDTQISSKVYHNNGDYNDNYYDYECISSCDNSKLSENSALNEKTSTEEPNNTKQETITPPRSHNRSDSTVTEDKECSSPDSQNKAISDQTSSTNPQPQKSLKKPDDVLPCPRCNSMSTKFCYYNNYNVHQPRHFCRACQRYWTAGGATRNVPVGSGRRKYKSVSSNSQNRHFLVPYQRANQRPWDAVSWQFSTVSTCHDSHSLKKQDRGSRIKINEYDDPIKAVNSSMWTTIGSNRNSISKSGFFGGVQVREYNGYEHYETSYNSALSTVLKFNPPAFSRSLSFREIAR